MRRILPWVALSAILLSGRAAAWGLGVEGGFNVATPPSPFQGNEIGGWAGGDLGIVAEHKIALPLLFLDPWADVQFPGYGLQMGTENGGAYSNFVPFDLGLRAGLDLGLLQPYAGLLAQLAFLTSSGRTVAAGGGSWSSVVPGVGGDLGLDFAFWKLRLGLEARVVGTANVSPTFPTNAWVFQGLTSARFEF